MRCRAEMAGWEGEVGVRLRAERDVPTLGVAGDWKAIALETGVRCGLRRSRRWGGGERGDRD